MIKTRQGRERARKKVRERLDELRHFALEEIKTIGDGVIVVAERRLETTLSDVLSDDPIEHSRYSDAAELNVRVNPYGGWSVYDYREAIRNRVNRSCALLEALLERMDELDQDEGEEPMVAATNSNFMNPRDQAVALTKALYEMVKNEIGKMVHYREPAATIQMSEGVARNALQYAAREGWIEHVAIGGQIRITNAGIDLAIHEQGIQLKPIPSVGASTPFNYNVVIANNITGSNLQQGTTGSTQAITQSLSGDQVKALTEVLNGVKVLLDKINEKTPETKLVEANASTVLAQMESPKPNKTIIREALEAIREGVMGGLKKYTETLVPQVPTLLMTAIALFG